MYFLLTGSKRYFRKKFAEQNTYVFITYEDKFEIFFAELFCKNISLVNVESANGQRQLSAWLGALLNFTATTTWNVFQKPAFSKLAPGMEKLCQAFLSHLLTGKQNSYIGL